MPSNVSKARKAHRDRLRHRDHLQRPDGGLRRRDQARARDRREGSREVVLPGPILEPRQPARATTTAARARRSPRPGRRAHHALRRGPGDERHHHGARHGASASTTRAPCAPSPSSRRIRCTGSRGSSICRARSCRPSTRTRDTTRRCASAPRTAGTWPIAWRARRASTSATRRARPCSPPSRSRSAFTRSRAAGVSSPSYRTAEIATSRR